MASISVIHATVSSESATSSTSFVEVAESSALTSGKTYYVICNGYCEGSSTAHTFEWRLVDLTNDDAVLSNSTLIREPQTANSCQSYYYVGRFTAGTKGGGLAFEQRTVTALNTARTQYLSMMIFDLSNLQTTDYFYNNNTSDTNLTDSFQSFASQRMTNLSANDNWLVFGWQATAVDKLTASTEIQLHCDDGDDGTEPQISFEGEDLTEQLGWWLCRAYTVTGADATWTIKARDDVSSATPNNHLESTLFGLRLGAFKNHTSTFISDETESTSTAWLQMATQSLTPDNTGDVIAVAYSTYDADGASRKSLQRIQIDGTTSPNTQPDTENAANAHATSDELGLGYITKYSGTKQVSATADYDVRYANSVTKGWKQITLAMFSLDLDVPVNFSSVASSTYASGDVASSTYNSGDIAAEVNP